MATTKETMKVIAKGIDEKEEPDVIPAKTIIRVEVPDELADIIERDIDSISICRKKEDMKREEIAPEDEYEAADVEELAEQIIFEIAEKAAADFVLFAGEGDPECVLLVLEVLRKRFFSSLSHALRIVFLTAGWDAAVWRLDLLDTCCEYDEATDELFYDYFFTSEAMTDYLITHFPDDEDEKTNSPDIKLN